MATNIAIDVYEFSTGMSFNQKFTHGITVANIVSYDKASVYDFKGTYFTGVNSKITENAGGVLKSYFVAQTVAAIKTLLDA